jgi:RimJ/RimL family protein N-acetyltransferase
MINGKSINLRSLEFEDLPELRDWRNSEHIRKSTREYRLLNMINQKNWFESIHVSSPNVIMFGIINNNKLIGVTGLTYIDWKNRHAEISIYIHKKGWQKIPEAKDTLLTIMRYGFGELNLHRLWVEIFETTPENISLFKKMKFVKEGTSRQTLWRKNKWWDSQFFSILSKEFKNK